MLTMLKLVPVGTAETILSLNAKDRVSQLGGTQATGSSMPQLVHESLLAQFSPPQRAWACVLGYLQGEGRIFGAQVSTNSSFSFVWVIPQSAVII